MVGRGGGPEQARVDRREGEKARRERYSCDLRTISRAYLGLVLVYVVCSFPSALLTVCKCIL